MIRDGFTDVIIEAAVTGAPIGCLETQPGTLADPRQADAAVGIFLHKIADESLVTSPDGGNVGIAWQRTLVYTLCQRVDEHRGG